jgi:CheY-like chemotaxis protein
MSIDPMNRTILIVDDNPAEREIFSTYLEFVGGRLLQARDGAEGLKVARQHRPDLILLDLTMPVMDGWEMIRHVQAEPALAGIPVLALTSHHLPFARLEEAGFCGYLEKPIAPFRVLEEVERCLGPLFRFQDGSGSDAGERNQAGIPHDAMR